MSSALRLLVVGALPRSCDPGCFVVTMAADAAAAGDIVATREPFDAVLLDGDSVVCSAQDIELLGSRSALVVTLLDPDAEHALGWIRGGADDVLGPAELSCATGLRRIRFAIERRRRFDGREPAYSTDSGTGLPHRQQLIEHLSQLLALREREPAPMAVLAIRVEGLEFGEAGSGSADSDALRRKIAVRLRAGVRASDVVAVVDDVAFAVLLGSILASADAERVAAKLVASLLVPFTIGGVERSVAVATGIGHYPQDGTDAERLLRRSLLLAAAAPAAQQAAQASATGAGAAARRAANDER